MPAGSTLHTPCHISASLTKCPVKNLELKCLKYCDIFEDLEILFIFSLELGLGSKPCDEVNCHRDGVATVASSKTIQTIIQDVEQEAHCNLTLHKNGSGPKSKSGSISASHVALQEG